jgi:DNA-binding HxlR family transcriptional regulator
MSMKMISKPILTDTCNVAYAANLIGGKWKISIIWELASGQPKRLAELRRNIIGISEGVLIAQLKSLEHEGLVLRRPFPEVPPRVEYELSKQGRLLIPIIDGLERWGNRHRQTRNISQRSN